MNQQGEKKLSKWLMETGFPLEMRVALALSRTGFDVQQSYIYPDPESGKGREIDVIASYPDFIGRVQVSYVFECKASKNPWIVFTSDAAATNYNKWYGFSVRSSAADKELSDRVPKGLRVLQPYLEQYEVRGYGFRQAFGNESDPAYSAAVSVLKACHALTQERLNYPRKAFSFPILVIDSPLYECSLVDEAEEPCLVAVERSRFHFSAYIPERVSSCVTVLSLASLPAFSDWAYKFAELIYEELGYEKDILSLKADRESRPS